MRVKKRKDRDQIEIKIFDDDNRVNVLDTDDALRLAGEIIRVANKHLPKGPDDTAYDNGEWHAMTMGIFIGLLVDSGDDPAVLMRVLEDVDSKRHGSFVRRLEVLILPDGDIKEQIEIVNPQTIGKRLRALVKSWIVE